MRTGGLEEGPDAAGFHVLVELLVEAGPGADIETVAVAGDGLGRLLLDGEAQARGVTEDAPDADRVLGVARIGVADDADAAGFEVVEAADVIDDGVGGDVVEESVDREIAAESVFARGAVGDGLEGETAAALGGGGGSGQGTLGEGTGEGDRLFRVLPGKRSWASAPAPVNSSAPLLSSSREASAARASSSSRSAASSSSSGLRRKVETSMILPSWNLTWASRNRRPMRKALRKSFLI